MNKEPKIYNAVSKFYTGNKIGFIFSFGLACIFLGAKSQILKYSGVAFFAIFILSVFAGFISLKVWQIKNRNSKFNFKKK